MESSNGKELQMKNQATLTSRLLQGAGIAAILLGLFLTLGISNPQGNFSWLILPLVLVPASGAFGGYIYYMTDPMRQQGGNKKLLANCISLAAFVILIFIAFALGMNRQA